MIRVHFSGLLAVILLGILSATSLRAYSAASESSVLEYYETIDQVLFSTGKTGLDTFFGLDHADVGIVQLSRPVAVAASGPMVFIADADERAIIRYDIETQSFTELLDASDTIRYEVGRIFVDDESNFYVTEPASGRVYYFDVRGQLLQTFKNKENLSHPVAIALNKRNKDLIVADGLFDHLIYFNDLGWPLHARGGRGDGPMRFHKIIDLTQQGDRMYLLDEFNDDIQVLTLDAKFIESFKRTEVERPTAIAVDQDGRVFISDQQDDTIKIYYKGKLVEVFGGTGFGDEEFNVITDMWIDQDLLYIADSLNGRIQILNIIPGGLRDNRGP